MNKDLGRLLTAMVTPFTADGEVDYKKAAELADMLVQTGTEGIVVSGTTGESPTLTHEEEYELFRVVKETVKNKASVIAGTGSNSTVTTITATKMAEEIGVDAAMVVVPYYNKPSQEGMFRHFQAVAGETSLPIIIYNIPGRTGVNMEVDTVKRLAAIDNFIAIKEASGDLDQVRRVIEDTPEDFRVYSGDDGLTLDIVKMGGYGVISVAAHVAGRELSELIRLCVSGDVENAQKIHNKLSALFNVLFITANPTPVKAALSMVWKDVGIPRLPLIEATQREKQQIRKVLEDIGKL